MAEEPNTKEPGALSNSFYKQLIVLATLFVGFMYLDKSLKDTISDSLKPYIEKQNEIEKVTKENFSSINLLKQENALNSYKWSIYEQQIKDFIKPDEIHLKKKN